LTNNFKTGRTGNESLRMAIADSKAAGLPPTIYTHPPWVCLDIHWDNVWDVGCSKGSPCIRRSPSLLKYRLCYWAQCKSVSTRVGNITSAPCLKDLDFMDRKDSYVKGRQANCSLLL
jgi:hypothetical protein